MAAPAIFVHDAGDRLFGPVGTIIALTPDAFEGCRLRGLTPSVVDDHTPRPELCRLPRAYERWQLDWLNRLDNACHLDGVGRSCAELIVPPLDSLVVASRTLAGVVDALVPTTIEYIGRGGMPEAGYHSGNLGFWPRLGDVPLAARLLPLIAQARDLPFNADWIDPRMPVKSSAPSLLPRIRRRLAKIVGPYRRGYARRHVGGAHPQTTLMLWYAGYGAAQFAADEHRAARGIACISRGGSSFRIHDVALPPRHRPSDPIDLRVPEVTTLMPSLMRLLDEIDGWAGVPGAGRIFATRLAIYLHGVCPAVACAATQVGKEFSHFDVQRVAAANPSSLEEFACLIAAGRMLIPRVLVQHGDHLMSYGLWLVTATVDFEEFMASDATVAEDLRAEASALGVTAPRVTYYAPRVQALVSKASGTSPRRERRPETICYVPCFMIGDFKRVGGLYFDDTWYYRWHLRLLDLMMSRPDLRFIWKALPSTDLARDPVADIVAGKPIQNVTYERRPFVDVINDVDRVFTDYPSTALYEAVHLGKPVLALSFERFFVLRTSAAARFQQVLRVCRTEEDALNHLQGFIDDPPSRWILPPEMITRS
jgi:hypothetical protein